MSELRPTVARRFAVRALRMSLAVVALVAMPACRTAATGATTVTPGGGDDPDIGADPDGRQESDNVGDLKARLDRLRIQHESMSSSNATGFAVCEDLCELSTNICSVKDKLCELADKHPADDSYQALCREAKQECREATESCVKCAQNGSDGAPANSQ